MLEVEGQASGGRHGARNRTGPPTPSPPLRGASRSRSHCAGARGRGATCAGRPGGRAGACSPCSMQPPLVAGQRHPLRQHVVGVGQPRAAVRPRLVGELDAVLAEQPAGLRQVGDDRLVRVDQVGVRRARAVASLAGPSARAAPQTRMKPRSRYIAHSSSLTHDSQQLARALLGAALAARVVVEPRRRSRAGAAALRALAQRRQPTTSHSSASDDDRGGAEREQHDVGRLSARPRRAGRRSRARRRAGRRRSSRPSAPRAGRRVRSRHGGPHALVELRAGTPRRAAPPPRARSTSPSAMSTSP